MERHTASSEIIPRGLAFVRFAKALAAARGDFFEAREIAQKWRHSTPRTLQALEDRIDPVMVQMALRDPATTTDSDWAQPLVSYRVMVNEFVDALRPITITGRLPNVRKVPLNVRYLTQSGGATVNWIGEGGATPVGEMSLASETLGIAKASGILICTRELAENSTPAAESLFGIELRAALVEFLDRQFINPSVFAVANVSPASITNGSTAIISSGTTVAAIVADFAALFEAVSNGTNMVTPVLIMTPASAIGLALRRDSAGGPAFPGITVNGGSLFGVPVIVSASVPGSVSGGTIIVLVDASEIIIGNEDLLTIDISTEASVQMESSPASGPQQLVSFFSLNLVGIKVVVYRNWKRRRDAAVAYIDGVTY